MVFPNMVRRFEGGGEEDRENKKKGITKKKSWTDWPGDRFDDATEWTDKQFRNAYHAIGDDWRNLVYPLVSSVGGAAVGTGIGALIGSAVSRNYKNGAEGREIEIPKFKSAAFKHFKDKKGKSFLYDKRLTPQMLADVQAGRITPELAAILSEYATNARIYSPQETLTPDVQTKFWQNKLNDLKEKTDQDPRIARKQNGEKDLGYYLSKEDSGAEYKFPQIGMDSPIDTFRSFRKTILKPWMTKLHDTYLNSGGPNNYNLNAPSFWLDADEKDHFDIMKELSQSYQHALGTKNDPTVRNIFGGINALKDKSPFKNAPQVFTEKFNKTIKALSQSAMGTRHMTANENFDPMAVRTWLTNMGYGPERTWKMAKPFVYNKFLKDYYQYGPDVLRWAKAANKELETQYPGQHKEVIFGKDPNVSYSRVLRADPKKVFAQHPYPSGGYYPEFWNRYYSYLPDDGVTEPEYHSTSKSGARRNVFYAKPGIEGYRAQQDAYQKYQYLQSTGSQPNEQLRVSQEYIDMMNAARQYQDQVLQTANANLNTNTPTPIW